MKPKTEIASFEAQSGERARIAGPLDLDSVSALLSVGDDAIRRGQAAVIDLAGVTHTDSAGLALLIEWLSVARSDGRALRYENVPTQILHLCQLSEVEALLIGH